MNASTQEKVAAVIAKALQDLEELGIRDAVMLYSFLSESGDQYELGWQSVGSPYGNEGMMHTYLSIDQSSRIGRAVAANTAGPDDDSEFWKET